MAIRDKIRLIVFIHLVAIALLLNIASAEQQEKMDDLEGKMLTLAECIRIAVEIHPDIRSKMAEVNAGKARTGQAFSSFLPALDLSSGYSKSRFENQESSSVATSGSAENYTIGLYLSQNIFDFGRSLSRWKMTREEAAAISYILNTTGQEVVFNVEETYCNHLKALRMEKVNREALASAEFHLKQASGFYEAGTRAKIDVVRAQVDLSNARVELIKAKNMVRLSKVSLDNAMGLGEPAAYQIRDDLEFRESNYDMDEMVAAACRNRPDLLSLDAGLKALDYEIDLRQSGHLPELSARFSYDWKGDSAPLDREWKAAITLDFPIFSGLDTSWKISEAHDKQESLKAQRESLKLQIRKEVEQAFLSLKEARERLSAAKTGADQARENLRLARGRYRAGLATIIDLSDARVLLLRADTSRIEALYDYRIADASIKKAAGTIPFRLNSEG